MSQNTETVERYLDGFRRSDHAQILTCLADDIEWHIPGVFTVQGKAEFAGHIIDEGFTGSPVIEVTRLLESRSLVVVEGSVRAGRMDGGFVYLAFCDLFEMSEGRISRLTSYLMQVPADDMPA